MISIVRKAITEKVDEVNDFYQLFIDMNKNRKEFALKYIKNPNFSFVMEMAKGIDLYDLVKSYIKDKTKRLVIAREWLVKIDPNFQFKASIENDDDDN